MLIKQTRIINLSKLSYIDEGEVIRIAIDNLERFKDRVVEIGFKTPIKAGDTILPKTVGAVSNRNANGDYEIHRDQEKETCYRMIEWTYKQWAGRGKTVEVTDSTDKAYERYPRTFIPPQSVELTVIEKDKKLIIISPEITFNQENKDIIVHVVNLFLEIFGECRVLNNKNQVIKIPEVIKLNWEVLPKGKMPWKKRKIQIKNFINRAKGTNKDVVKKRLEEINKFEPDFTAIGNGGFNGYIIHGFIDKSLYVLESIYTNNATYVLENDWEFISKLTKGQILNNDLHKERIIHTKSWYKKINKLLNDIN
ncbi:hypothetical protein BX659_13612 [Orenia metallireducens]|uniref:Uncharacterized protein n=1 Tax=Orenia metallireducens TaxID=1413210 RepID=A0A285IF33_9FIRM|nr:hypothetical protein [Orenia metallireducens]PRX20133.1 hypothetical protein BX659_13612 [Orenia metallireducens]SNY45676.1 hypothetical protein SAMN06265827_13912 [Orenia metallireducens]